MFRRCHGQYGHQGYRLSFGFGGLWSQICRKLRLHGFRALDVGENSPKLVWSLKLRLGSGFGVQGLGFRVWGFGCRDGDTLG